MLTSSDSIDLGLFIQQERDVPLNHAVQACYLDRVFGSIYFLEIENAKGTQGGHRFGLSGRFLDAGTSYLDGELQSIGMFFLVTYMAPESYYLNFFFTPCN